MNASWKDVAARILVLLSALIVTSGFIFVLRVFYSSFSFSTWAPIIPSVIAAWVGVWWVFRGRKSEASVLMRMAVSIVGAWMLFIFASFFLFLAGLAGRL